MSKSHYIIPVFVPHEGCPHNCIFCNQSSITGEENIVDAEYTRETIEKYLKTIGNNNPVIEVSFYGGTFTAINIKKQKELLSVAKEYKDKNLIQFIHLSTRPDYIDDSILQNLKDYSVDIIELGIQSLDEEVLLQSCRGHSASDAEAASKLIKSYGFTLGHQIMIGLPGDTPDKDIKTTLGIIKLKPDICRIYPALVIKNTGMELLFNKGEYKPYTLNEAVNISKIIYGMLASHGINVIRIGLQPTEEINVGKEIVSGPFHPAFRELVEGSLFCDMIVHSLDLERSSEVTIFINDKDISKLYADKKQFFNEMEKLLKRKNIKVISDRNLNRGKLLIEDGDKFSKVSLFDYISEKYYNYIEFDYI